MKDIKMVTPHDNSVSVDNRASSLSKNWLKVIWPTLLLSVVLSGGVKADSLGASFFDDFTTFDMDRWYISDGWSNGDHQNCVWSESAVVHEKGLLGLYFEEKKATHTNTVVGKYKPARDSAMEHTKRVSARTTEAVLMLRSLHISDLFTKNGMTRLISRY